MANSKLGAWYYSNIEGSGRVTLKGRRKSDLASLLTLSLRMLGRIARHSFLTSPCKETLATANFAAN